MQINGIRFKQSFVRRVRSIFANHGPVVAGMFCAGNRVPAGAAMAMMGIPTNLVR